ncbi:MAG: hypothetical protein IJV51_06505 [Oscillospiraceae bacterium]|nr:hypothetical protein [Oscillospiraceae bacterium]
MFRRKHVSAISLALMLVLLTVLLCGCGKIGQTAKPAEPTAEPSPAVESAPVQPSPTPVTTPAPTEPVSTPAPTPTPVQQPVVERQNGERFEGTMTFQGMEETIKYEHIRNDALGFEMDYDYERFVRQSEPDRERFISAYDDPEQPENYLEVTSHPENAETVAAFIADRLSNEYESKPEPITLDRAGNCIHIEASVIKGTNQMAEHLQSVYIFPAFDGCRVAISHCYITDSEFYSMQIHRFMNTFSVIANQAESRITDEQAVSAVRNYCLAVNPELMNSVNAGDAPVYWDLSSSDENQIVVVFRSYTGALNRYYIDPVSGEAYVTEFVPGITEEEQRTGETLNVRNYLQ